MKIRPETEWSNYEQIEEQVKLFGGSNPRVWHYTGMICD